MGIIYQAKNKLNGKRYIGKTCGDFEGRKYGHLATAREGRGFYFHCAIRKYGPDAFEWEIIYWCPDHKLDEMEIEMIAWFGSKAPNGYNLTEGGDGPTGVVWSEEARNAKSEWMRNRWSNGLVNVTSEASNRKRSETLQGHSVSNEARKRMSLAKKGKPGRKWTAAQKKALSEKTRGRKFGPPASEETRKKISEALKGRRHTEQAKEKMRIKAKRFHRKKKGTHA